MSRRAGQCVFVAGTDTGVGKTEVTSGLLRAARRAGVDACGYKPVASGARQTGSGLRNDDALALMKASANDEPYESINPIVFSAAVAPHLAARGEGKRIVGSKMTRGLDALRARHAWVLVEGAGGWRVPLAANWDFSDWVAEQGLPVLLVVGMRLGCINHALLSAESILKTNPLLGWVANELPPRQPLCDDNIQTLKRRMPAPFLGRVRARQRNLESIWKGLTNQQGSAPN